MTADLVIHNAAVFTGTDRHPTATAVALADGRIAAVGTDDEVRAAVGSARETLDARGGLLAPSFIDAHVHPLQGGHEMLRCDLTQAVNADDCLRIISEYAQANPELDWITGGGWRMPFFPGGTPGAELLERAAPGRAVYLVNADHHGAWVSPEALRRAGIDADTPDPAGGRIERHPDGRPSGTLQEGAMELLARHLPQPDTDDYIEALLTAQDYLHSVGVTGWQDAIVGDYAGFGDSTDAYLAVREQGRLTARVTGALWLDRSLRADQIDDVVAGLVARRERTGDGRFRATSIKIMQDGVAESRTAAMKAPYLDRCGHPTDHSGTSHFAPEVLNAVVPRLAEAGFQLHFHTIGDRALAEVLDALDTARDKGDDGAMRHHIAHLQSVDPVDIKRLAALGVTANLQALWACNDAQMLELTEPIFGAERYGQQYPFAAFAAAGVPLAMGSDWPVSTPDPWQAIHVAVNRMEPGDDNGRALAPDQALDLTTALGAYTRGSARVTHQDDVGLIEVGRPADLALTDCDPFAVAPSELHRVSTRATWIDGGMVYQVD